MRRVHVLILLACAAIGVFFRPLERLLVLVRSLF